MSDSGNSNYWSNHGNHELWRAFRNGKRDAFAELFSRFFPRLFRYGTKLVSNEEMVKDGIQELFLTLWRNRQDLGDADSVEFYLLFSLRRILFREKKTISSQQKRNIKYSEGLLWFEESREKKIIFLETKEERYKLYQEALLILTDRQREALRLRMEYGLDNREISEIMDLSEKRVRNLIYEGIKRLREWVARFESSMINMN